ncbi:MAG: hypothetical protein AB4372_04925 [Xenococcus sp. (in: cyanobacteria)]
MEKFTPKNKDLPSFQELDLLGNVSESDLWDAINDWIANQEGEFNQLVNTDI